MQLLLLFVLDPSAALALAALAAGEMFEFNGSVTTYQLVGIVVSVLIPIAVDLVTKRLAQPRVKALTLAALTAVNGFLLEFLQSNDTGQPFQFDQALLNLFVSFIIAAATLYGFWRPVGVSGSTGAVATRVPGGLGTPRRA